MPRLEPGMAAPDFALEDATGRVWRLSDLRGQKVVVYFYPIDDTPGCTIEACDFRDAHVDFSGSGYVVLGISPQDANSHQAFAGKYQLNFPLLVDADEEVARAYGAREHRGEHEGLPLLVNRSTFVIDEDRKIVDALYDVKAKGHVQELREKLGV